MLLDANADVNQVAIGGTTALIEAASNGYNNIVERLIQKGSHINHVNCKGWSALDHAASWGNPVTMKILLEANADVRHIQYERNCAVSPINVGKENINGISCFSLLQAAGGFVSGYESLFDEEKAMWLSLLGISRRRIREYLLSPSGGDFNNLFVAIPKLPLPYKIKQFLLFDIDLDSIS